MAASEKTGGSTTTLTIGSEQTLATITDAGVYQGWMDMDPFALGDRVLLRVYLKHRSTATLRLVQEIPFDHDLGPIHGYTDIFISPFEFQLRALQTAGTARTPVWSVLQP